MVKRKTANVSQKRKRRKQIKPPGNAKESGVSSWARNRRVSKQVALGALDAIADALIVCDGSGRVVFLNQAAIDLYGNPESDPSMQKCARNYGVFWPDGRTLLKAEELPLLRALNGEELTDVELVVRPPLTGKGSRVRVNARPLRSAGRIVGAAVLTKLKAETDSSRVPWPEMAEAISHESNSANPRWLQSWKEISEYVGRTPRTIQRWETLGFPVRRPTGKPRSAVLASTAEIDAWLSSRPRLMKSRAGDRLMKSS